MQAPQLPSYKDILDLYFKQSDGRQIISHQIESFNHFMEIDIPEITTMVNPLIVRGSPEIPLSGPRSALASATGLSTSAANALMGVEAAAHAEPLAPVNREYEVMLEFENPSLRKPTIFENNGAVLPMMPNDARMRNLTYASPLFVDVRVTTTFIDNTKGGVKEVRERLFPNVHLGKIPVMNWSNMRTIICQLGPILSIKVERKYDAAFTRANACSRICHACRYRGLCKSCVDWKEKDRS